jgi:hypothetical protein
LVEERLNKRAVVVLGHDEMVEDTLISILVLATFGGQHDV